MWLNPLFRNKKKPSTITSSVKDTRYPPWLFWLRSHWLALKESLKKITQKPLSFFLTITVIGITLALPAILYVILNNFQNITNNWNNKPTISIYLPTTITAENTQQLIQQLKEQPNVTAVNYISPEEGLNDFKKFSEFSDVLPLIKTNPLPPVISVTFAHFDPNAMSSQKLLHYLNHSSLVDQVSIDTEWVQKMEYSLSIAKRVILTLALLLCVGVILIMSNTIRLITQAHQHEIAILKFVGATPSYIRRPFLYHGCCFGVLGGLLAWLLVIMVTAFIAPPLLKLVESYHETISLYGSSFIIGGSILIASALLSLTGAWLALQQYLSETL